jgi:serine/threonine-protein kinase
MSPEKVLGTTVDERTDIYSLGVIAFQLLTGKLPFSAREVMEQVARHLSEAPPDVRELRPGVSAGLAECIERMLAKKPEERVSLDELRSALQSAQDERFPRRESPHPVRSGRRWAIVALVIAAPIGVGLALVARAGAEEKEAAASAQEPAAKSEPALVPDASVAAKERVDAAPSNPASKSDKATRRRGDRRRHRPARGKKDTHRPVRKERDEAREGSPNYTMDPFAK